MFWWEGRENCLESNDVSISRWNRLYSREKSFIRIILNLNAFTINPQKQFIECLGKTQTTGKITPPLVHPTIYSTPDRCPPVLIEIVLWIGQYIIFMSVFYPQLLSCRLDNIFYLWVPVNFNIHKILRSHGILTSNRIFDIQWNISRLGFSTYRNMHTTIIHTRLLL